MGNQKREEYYEDRYNKLAVYNMVIHAAKTCPKLIIAQGRIPPGHADHNEIGRPCLNDCIVHKTTPCGPRRIRQVEEARR